MGLRMLEIPEDQSLRHRAQRRAVWDFMATVEDLRCAVCHKRIDYDDRQSFEATTLCPACTHAVNQEMVTP
jgi:hypothetical protein